MGSNDRYRRPHLEALILAGVLSVLLFAERLEAQGAGGVPGWYRADARGEAGSAHGLKSQKPGPP